MPPSVCRKSYSNAMLTQEILRERLNAQHATKCFTFRRVAEILNLNKSA